MELPLLGKVKRPLPVLMGLMATGIVLVGSGTFLAIAPKKPKIDLAKLTVPVQSQNLTVRINANGTVQPIQSVNLSPKTSGRLAKLFVEQGDQLQQGQKVAQMENADLLAQLAKAQADLNQAQARLAESKAGSRQEEIDQAQARLDQAKANLDAALAKKPKEIDQAKAQVEAAKARVNLAQTRAQRYRNLAAQGAVTLDQRDEALTEERNAGAALNEAQKRLDQQTTTETPEIAQLKAAEAQARIALQQLRNGNRPEQINQLQGAVDAAKAQVQAIQVQLNDTVIRAPFSGIVTQRYATQGAFVTPTTSASNTASATSTSIIALAKGLEILAKVPEADIGQIKPGQQVEIVADAFRDKVFKGRVQRVAPEAVEDQNVTSFEVRVALVTGQKELRSGMNVDLTFLGEQVNNALVVPIVSIVTKEGETGVMVPDQDNKPKFQPVTIGSTFQNQTQILNGLKPGQRVFIDLPKDFNRKDKQENKK
ncbi:MAG TPA: efflux transporter periplasmic adaptor subunit [Cyanobacteria bacterium UBA8553]|nr:efflux transporter periplasmic adaptor subunit [Cyanobacteria bacterium UBA8553]HAJ60823.1 efflux transporter periplasmic adaptor subunit [Cyanobacteria bacterium UBA8543]